MQLKTSLLVLCLGLLAPNLFHSAAYATPWADAEDTKLRHHLQILADAGLIQFSSTTYPLLWGAFLENLSQTDPRQLEPRSQEAYHYVMAVLDFHQSGGYTGGRISGQSELGAERGFGQDLAEKAALTLTRDFKSDHSAFRLQTSFRRSREALPGRARDPESISFVGSYAATIVSHDVLGSWVLSADQLTTWWSPSYENDGMHTRSEQPLQALRLTRAGAAPFDATGLRWFGPWSATAYVGRSARSLGIDGNQGMFRNGVLSNGSQRTALGTNTEMTSVDSESFRREEAFGARLTVNPLPSIELGARFTGAHLERTQKNAALDARVTVFSGPAASLSVYGEVISHRSDLDETFHTIGADVQFSSGLFSWFSGQPQSAARVFVERLEHVDREGMAIGFWQFTPAGYGLDVRVREYERNAWAGVRIPQRDYHRRQQFDLSVYIPLSNSRLVTGVNYWRDTPNQSGLTNQGQRDNTFNLFLDWEVRW